MKFLSFHIKNFKGIEDLKVSLNNLPESNVYTLIGLNESGKTTILEAINYFGYKTDDLSLLEMKGYQIEDVHNLIPINKIDNFNGTIQLTTEVEFEEGEYELIKKETKKQTDISIKHDIQRFTIDQQYIFENSRFVKKSNTWNLILTGIKGKDRKEKRWSGSDWQTYTSIIKSYLPEVLYFPNFLFEFPDKIYLEPQNGETKQYSFYKSLIQDILDSLDNQLDIEEHLIKRVNINDNQAKRHVESVLLKMSSKVTHVIFSAWNKIFNKQISKKEIQIEYGLGSEVEGGKEVPYIQFLLRDGEGIYRISERSLGFRWFFVFLLLTQFRSNRIRQSKKVLFLFDEPASNLHSTAQTQLLHSFEKLTNVIYTTHSHHLVNPKWLENTYVVKNEGLNYDQEDDNFNSRKTKITISPYRVFAAKFPGQTSYFQPILDVLEYQPSVLENVPNILITEGKNDYYTLMYMRFILQIKNDLHIMPGTSANKLDTPIQLYLAWARNFIVLLDADKEERLQKKRYIDMFGAAVENRIFTLEDIDSSWKDRSCEDLFEGNDIIKLIQSKHPDVNEYNKSIFNRVIQENLINNIPFTFSKKTNENFSKLMKHYADNI